MPTESQSVACQIEPAEPLAAENSTREGSDLCFPHHPETPALPAPGNPRAQSGAGKPAYDRADTGAITGGTGAYSAGKATRQILTCNHMGSQP